MFNRPGLSLVILAAVLQFACIRAKNYHPNESTYHYKYPTTSKEYGDNYFRGATADEAYLEFDARGSMYRDAANHTAQLDAVLRRIHEIRYRDNAHEPQKMALYVFIHGWKNNAGEATGNVWGFRRFLSDIAAEHEGTPVLGLYIGWPGASLKNDAFLSFWNREPIADNVGNGELADALRQVLRAVKGVDYKDDSVAVVIGHSFGGIVLEHAATRLLREQLNSPDPNAYPPADLFVLLNEAGSAAIARPFLLELLDRKVEYANSAGPRPLLLSMTSRGDIATKIAYPGGEFFSINRPKPQTFDKPDPFGQTSSQPYELLTTANMGPLRSHEIAPISPTDGCAIPIDIAPALRYCMRPLDPKPANTTPYWVMELPQIFVPTHTAIFEDYLLELLKVVASDSAITRPSAKRTFAAAGATTPPDRPRLRRAR